MIKKFEHIFVTIILIFLFLINVIYPKSLPPQIYYSLSKNDAKTKNSIFVEGAVKFPGKYYISENKCISLNQIIEKAKLLPNKAYTDHAYIKKSHGKVIQFNLTALSNLDDYYSDSSSYALYSGDTLVIPLIKTTKIFVCGNGLTGKPRYIFINAIESKIWNILSEVREDFLVKYIYLYRKQKLFKINMHKVLYSNSTKHNILIKNNDIIYFAKRFTSKCVFR